MPVIPNRFLPEWHWDLIRHCQLLNAGKNYLLVRFYSYRIAMVFFKSIITFKRISRLYVEHLNQSKSHLKFHHCRKYHPVNNHHHKIYHHRTIPYIQYLQHVSLSTYFNEDKMEHHFLYLCACARACVYI